MTIRATYNPSELSLDSMVNENALRVTVTDLNAEVPYRNRIETDNESAIELTNTGASSVYLKCLGDNLNTMLNSGEWAAAISEESHFRVHRAGDEPTPIVVPTLANRTLTVNMKDPYTNNKIPVKLTVRQGETVRSKPVEDSLMISLCLERFDSEVDGVITANTMKSEIASIAEQLDTVVTEGIIKTLVEHENNAKYLSKQQVALKAGQSFAERLEAIEDAIDKAQIVGKQFGNDISDFTIGFNAQTMRDLQRAARRAGAADVSTYLGCDVYSFNGYSGADDDGAEDIQMVVAPRRYCAVSFREQADGTIFDIIVSRQANKQSTTMELMGVADLLVAGFTKAKTEDGKDVDVTLPLVQVYTAGVPTP
ncbi:hypothetical protein [Aeromonas veronii]|uniref:hypothetical protein n=1 Tax=Aeromonas veronii TaxID=654 RepID=UPI000E1F4110|nr:hypothetical protein [Aeromonas veronii]RDU78604.1 hypothetical protein CHF44_19155 [Aeromonas veronii]RDU89429.1 hypothetical protein CHH34_19715 [Aeromonas veronii]TEY60229.1 hypothetical protein CIG15_19215 [Aeromonas veronii]